MATIYTYNGQVIREAATGKWFIEAATPPVPSDEVTIGTQIWKTFYLDIDDGQGGVYAFTAIRPYTTYCYTDAAADRIINANYSGFHRATQADYNTLFTYANVNDVNSLNSLFATEYGGGGVYGLNLIPLGALLIDNNDIYNEFGQWYSLPSWSSYQQNSSIHLSGPNGTREYAVIIPLNWKATVYTKYGPGSMYYPVRLVKDAV